MDKETLIDDMMRDAVTDAKLFRTYDDDYEVIDRDQVMRCLANLDKAIRDYSVLSAKSGLSSINVDAVFTALTIMQTNLKKAVEHEAEKSLKSKREMESFGERE